VVGFGEGFPLPTRLSFKALSMERVPRSETFREDRTGDDVGDSQSFVRQVVERWRGAAGAKLVGREEPAVEATGEGRPAVAAAAAPAMAAYAAGGAPAAGGGVSPVSNRIEQIRAQLLRR